MAISWRTYGNSRGQHGALQHRLHTPDLSHSENLPPPAQWPMQLVLKHSGPSPNRPHFNRTCTHLAPANRPHNQSIHGLIDPHRPPPPHGPPPRQVPTTRPAHARNTTKAPCPHRPLRLTNTYDRSRLKEGLRFLGTWDTQPTLAIRTSAMHHHLPRRAQGVLVRTTGLAYQTQLKTPPPPPGSTTLPDNTAQITTQAGALDLPQLHSTLQSDLPMTALSAANTGPAASMRNTAPPATPTVTTTTQPWTPATTRPKTHYHPIHRQPPPQKTRPSLPLSSSKVQ